VQNNAYSKRWYFTPLFYPSGANLANPPAWREDLRGRADPLNGLPGRPVGGSFQRVEKTGNEHPLLFSSMGHPIRFYPYHKVSISLSGNKEIEKRKCHQNDASARSDKMQRIRQGSQIKTLTRDAIPEGFSLNDCIALARIRTPFIIHAHAGPPFWLSRPRKLFLEKALWFGSTSLRVSRKICGVRELPREALWAGSGKFRFKFS